MTEVILSVKLKSSGGDMIMGGGGVMGTGRGGGGEGGGDRI